MPQDSHAKTTVSELSHRGAPQSVVMSITPWNKSRMPF